MAKIVKIDLGGSVLKNNLNVSYTLQQSLYFIQKMYGFLLSRMTASFFDHYIPFI
jgi:hypothetical protein